MTYDIPVSDDVYKDKFIPFQNYEQIFNYLEVPILRVSTDSAQMECPKTDYHLNLCDEKFVRLCVNIS